MLGLRSRAIRSTSGYLADPRISRFVRPIHSTPPQLGNEYVLVAKSSASKGCYGLEYSDAAPYGQGKASYSSDSGAHFTVEARRSLKFESIIDRGSDGP